MNQLHHGAVFRPGDHALDRQDDWLALLARFDEHFQPEHARQRIRVGIDVGNNDHAPKRRQDRQQPFRAVPADQDLAAERLPWIRIRRHRRMRPNTKKRHAARITHASERWRKGRSGIESTPGFAPFASQGRRSGDHPAMPACQSGSSSSGRSRNAAAPGIVSSLLLLIVRLDFLDHLWIDRRFRTFALLSLRRSRSTKSILPLDLLDHAIQPDVKPAAFARAQLQDARGPGGRPVGKRDQEAKPAGEHERVKPDGAALQPFELFIPLGTRRHVRRSIAGVRLLPA